MMEYIKWNMVLFADTVRILRGGKKMSLSIISHLSIFLFPPPLSHIPRVIPTHVLFSDFSRSLPVNIQHNMTFAAVPNPVLLCLHTAH